MSVRGVEQLAQNREPSKKTPATRRTGFTQQDFLKLLVAQLTKQDPLDPMKGNEFIQQITSIRNLEAITTLTNSLKSARKFEELAAASSLIGKNVRGFTISNLPVEGKVEKVRIEKENVYLIVSGRKMSLEGLSEIISGEKNNL